MQPVVFHVIPVLDVRNDLAVHAVAGDRAHYRPLQSVLHSSPDPIGLARACRDQLGVAEIYLADLDAIEHGTPNPRLFHELEELGLQLWIDAGLRDEIQLAPLVELDAATIVVGLETVRGARAVRAIADRAGPDRVVASIDLFEGQPRLAAGADWRENDPEALCSEIIGLGVRRLLLLDLARVGTSRGTGTQALLTHLAARHAALDLQLSIGGGIAGMNDVRSARQAGAAAVLVGSALHDGRIDRRQLDAL
jgi:phosphoribosylformimino-5-aminoimidazole carboxamide ribotide isomerase